MSKPLSTWYRKYRIVTDNYLGYEVQCWRIWWPIWVQCTGNGLWTNTHSTIERAEEFAAQHAGKFVVKFI